ncbi:PAS domain-containing protein [Sphingomonas sp. ID1715]|uniref:PAS domain-containing protein n=1 Tax=Sphingomonas sp. ID1715 TaxID=1656898 RepID=UPI0014896418|nr:PAS domain-containing protein [Sphingomonas sp. ID1715]NNM76692.1 PAS domain-containing protein [Sphingomonas sp. ID1715]
MKDVHPEDQQQVERALESVTAGETVQFEFRIVRPIDGAIRTLRETSFPIIDESVEVSRIGGITEDLTPEAARQAYIVCSRTAEARRLAALLRTEGYRVRVFATSSEFLDVAPILTCGCVLIDLRQARANGLSIPRELKSRMIALPTIALDAPGQGVGNGVTAMKRAQPITWSWARRPHSARRCSLQWWNAPARFARPRMMRAPAPALPG